MRHATKDSRVQEQHQRLAKTAALDQRGVCLCFISQARKPLNPQHHSIQRRRRRRAVPHACGLTVGHVVVLPQHTQHSLLPVAAAELVPDDRIPVETGLDIGSLQALAGSPHNGHLVHNGGLTCLVLT